MRIRKTALGLAHVVEVSVLAVAHVILDASRGSGIRRVEMQFVSVVLPEPDLTDDRQYLAGPELEGHVLQPMRLP